MISCGKKYFIFFSALNSQCKILIYHLYCKYIAINFMQTDSNIKRHRPLKTKITLKLSYLKANKIKQCSTKFICVAMLKNVITHGNGNTKWKWKIVVIFNNTRIKIPFTMFRKVKKIIRKDYIDIYILFLSIKFYLMGKYFLYSGFF